MTAVYNTYEQKGKGGKWSKLQVSGVYQSHRPVKNENRKTAVKKTHQFVDKNMCYLGTPGGSVC